MVGRRERVARAFVPSVAAAAVDSWSHRSCARVRVCVGLLEGRSGAACGRVGLGCGAMDSVAQPWPNPSSRSGATGALPPVGTAHRPGIAVVASPLPPGPASHAQKPSLDEERMSWVSSLARAQDSFHRLFADRCVGPTQEMQLRAAASTSNPELRAREEAYIIDKLRKLDKAHKNRTEEVGKHDCDPPAFMELVQLTVVSYTCVRRSNACARQTLSENTTMRASEATRRRDCTRTRCR